MYVHCTLYTEHNIKYIYHCTQCMYNVQSGFLNTILYAYKQIANFTADIKYLKLGQLSNLLYCKPAYCFHIVYIH